MELYREFFSIIKALNEKGLEYSVVGGIALAFHDQPRFTRDIDILAKPADLSSYAAIFENLGYHLSSEPWRFEKTAITLYRFAKHSQEHDDDLIVIDLLLGHEERHREIIQNSIADESPAGTVRLANRADLIWMKRLRNSKQDEADIDNLEHER